LSCRSSPVWNGERLCVRPWSTCCQGNLSYILL
jgi:hypothetical protein